MNKNIELIRDLIKQAETVEYGNGVLDTVEKRGEMFLRKFFGDDTHYLKSLKNISYSPRIFTSDTPDSVFRNSFYRGKGELLNLLNVIEEDISLDLVVNESEKKIDKSSLNFDNIFVVHGHNEEMKLAVARTIEKLRLKPIILHEQASKGKTIIEKFTDNSDVAFAIVILSADDIAYSKNQSQETAKFRARQNVIFELGYFIGKLGRDRVLALYEVDQNLEIPSDYSGVIFVPFDKGGTWKFELAKELKALNIPIDANDLL